MSTQFNSCIFILLFSLSIQDEISNKFLNSLKIIKPDLEMEIDISREYLKAKRQQELTSENNHIYKSMENITVETYWRYPKPVLRKEEQSTEQEVKPKRKKIQKNNIPNFMKPLEKNKDKVVPVKRDHQKHEILNEELIVPGNIISVEEALLEKQVEDREENYINFLKKAKFLFNFMYVDLNKYRQYNYLSLGQSKKYHDFRLIDRKNKFHDKFFPNIHFWFYSQEEDLNFYNLRAMVNNEYRFFDEFRQEQIMYENKGSFFGPRIANCWNDVDIFTSSQKAKEKFVTKEKINLTYNDQTFSAQLKEVSNSKINYLTIKVSSNESKQIKEAKRDFIDHITTIQMSKQQLNQIGFVGRFNKDDKCYYDLNFSQKTQNLELTFMFKIIEHDWSRLNAAYTGYKNLITKNCKVVQNQIYDNNYLGKRIKQKDLEVQFQRTDRNFYLQAYLQENRINYLVVYDITRQYFLSENIYESVLRTLQNNGINIDGCIYHNDNYLLEKDFDEVYMITFYQNIEAQTASSLHQFVDEEQSNIQPTLRDSVQSFNSLYEPNTEVQNKINNQTIHSMIQDNQHQDMESLKDEIKSELKQEIKDEVIVELKKYIDNRKLI